MRMLDLQSCCSPRKLETEIFLFLEVNSLEITFMLLCLKRNGTDVIYRSSSFRCIQFNITHTHLTFEDHKVPSAPHSFEIPEDYDFILTPSITTLFFFKVTFYLAQQLIIPSKDAILYSFCHDFSPWLRTISSWIHTSSGPE